MSWIDRENLRYKEHDPFKCFIFYSIKFGESPLLSRRSINRLFNNVVTEKHPAGFMQRMIYRREQHTEHPLEMTNMLYLSWAITWVDSVFRTGRIFLYTPWSPALQTGSALVPAAPWQEWAVQFSPTGLLHLCQRRAVFSPSHQIINKAKTFSFGHGKWKILMGVIPLSVRLPR